MNSESRRKYSDLPTVVSHWGWGWVLERCVVFASWLFIVKRIYNLTIHVVCQPNNLGKWISLKVGTWNTGGSVYPQKLQNQAWCQIGDLLLRLGFFFVFFESFWFDFLPKSLPMFSECHGALCLLQFFSYLCRKEWVWFFFFYFYYQRRSNVQIISPNCPQN